MANTDLRLRMKRSRTLQRAYWDTIESAANLAAGQVRDKRLEELEKPKGVSMMDIIIDILFAVALTPAAGKVIEMAFTAMIKPVLRSRGVLLNLSERTMEVEAVVTADGIAASRRFFQTDRSLKLTQNSDDRKALRDAATKLTTAAAGVGLGQVKQIIKPSTPSAKAPAPSVGGDSPAVMIQTFVARIASEQRTAVDIAHDHLEVAIEDAAAGDPILAQASALLDDNEKEQATVSDQSFVLELYKRFWEACIWVCLFDVDNLRRQRFETRAWHGDNYQWPAGYTWSAPDSLVQYWYGRFPHDGYGSTGSFNDLEQWVNDERAQKKSYGLTDKYIDENYPALDKGAELIKYFQTIERALQAGARDFGVQDALVK